MNRVIRSYYGFQFFFNLLLWVPVFYAIQRSSGLSDPQIFHIQSLYYIAFVAFEVPTGYLADRLGYRLSLRAGGGLLVLANLLPALSSNYTGFLVHFLLIAASRSLISGAASAYLYDYLKKRDQSKKYKEIEGKARSLGLMGKVACWPTVGYMMQVYLYLPYLLTAANAFMALVFASLLPDIGQKERIEQHKSSSKIPVLEVWRSFGSSMKSIFHNKLLFLIMLQGIGLFVMTRINQVNLFQPILTAKSFDAATFGWVMAGMTICEAYAASKSKYLAKYFSDFTAVFAMTVVIALSFILNAYSGQVGTVLSFCLFSLAAGLAFPIQKQLLNDHIGDNPRATVLSIESILDRSVSAIAVLPLGGLVASGQLREILLTAAGITMVGVFIILLLLRKQLAVKASS